MEELNNLIKQSEKLVIVKINADWCIACRTMQNHIMMVLPKYSKKVDYIEINIESNLEVMKEFKVNTIPTLIFIYKGSLVNKITGVISSSLFEEILIETLNDR